MKIELYKKEIGLLLTYLNMTLGHSEDVRKKLTQKLRKTYDSMKDKGE
jgi:hypothetical protein